MNGKPIPGAWKSIEDDVVDPMFGQVQKHRPSLGGEGKWVRPVLGKVPALICK